MAERISRTREAVIVDIPEGLLSKDGTKIKEACHRCGGCGQYSWNQMDGSMCYGCRGKGYVGWLDLDTYVRREQDRDRREAKKQREWEAKIRERQDRAENPDPRITALAEAAGFKVTAIPDGLRNGRGIAADLAHKFLGWGDLTEAQWGLVEKLTREIPERDLEAKERAEASRWIGEVGDRVDVEGEVVFTKWFDNEWGGTLLLKIQTDDGQAVVWWASGGAAPLIDMEYGTRGLERGDRVALRGTVKKLDTYEGMKQTVLTRCKVQETVAA